MRLQLGQCLVLGELTKTLRTCPGLRAAALLDSLAPTRHWQHLFVQMNKVVCPLALNARTDTGSSQPTRLFDFVCWGEEKGGRIKAEALAMPTELRGPIRLFSRPPPFRKASHNCLHTPLPQPREPAPGRGLSPTVVLFLIQTRHQQAWALPLTAWPWAGQQGHGGDKNCLGRSRALKQKPQHLPKARLRNKQQLSLPWLWPCGHMSKGRRPALQSQLPLHAGNSGHQAIAATRPLGPSEK